MSNLSHFDREFGCTVENKKKNVSKSTNKLEWELIILTSFVIHILINKYSTISLMKNKNSQQVKL